MCLAVNIEFVDLRFEHLQYKNILDIFNNYSIFLGNVMHFLLNISQTWSYLPVC